ncbi:MAG: hypothetical protein M3491_02345, partial [Actinomycetota bacterium]|nr:hypothetical protein [Actinomycetota bacterium]
MTKVSVVAMLFERSVLRKGALFATIFDGWVDLVGKALVFGREDALCCREVRRARRQGEAR